MDKKEFQTIAMYLRNQGFRQELIVDDNEIPKPEGMRNGIQMLSDSQMECAYEAAVPYRRIDNTTFDKAVQDHTDENGILSVPISDMVFDDTPRIILRCDGTGRGMMEALSYLYAEICSEEVIDLITSCGDSSKQKELDALLEQKAKIWNPDGDIAVVSLPAPRNSKELSLEQRAAYRDRMNNFMARLKYAKEDIGAYFRLPEAHIGNRVVQSLLGSGMMLELSLDSDKTDDFDDYYDIWSTIPGGERHYEVLEVFGEETSIIGCIQNLAKEWDFKQKCRECIKDNDDDQEGLYEGIASFEACLKICADRLARYTARQMNAHETVTERENSEYAEKIKSSEFVVTPEPQDDSQLLQEDIAAGLEPVDPETLSDDVRRQLKDALN